MALSKEQEKWLGKIDSNAKNIKKVPEEVWGEVRSKLDAYKIEHGT